MDDRLRGKFGPGILQSRKGGDGFEGRSRSIGSQGPVQHRLGLVGQQPLPVGGLPRAPGNKTIRIVVGDGSHRQNIPGIRIHHHAGSTTHPPHHPFHDRLHPGIQREINVLSGKRRLVSLLLQNKTEVVFLQNLPPGFTLQILFKTFFHPVLADDFRLERLQRLLFRCPHESHDVGGQRPVGIPTNRAGGFLDPGKPRIPLGNTREGRKVDLGGQLKWGVRSLLGVAAQLIHFVVHLDAQIFERLESGFLDNLVDIDLLDPASFFPRPHLHRGHRQTAPMSAGIISCKFPDVQVDIVPGAVFRQRHSIAVKNQSPRGREENGNGGLID